MKRETLRHPKTYDLASRLQCSRAQALGFLTLLWDFTADYAIGGDIGRVPDGAIARGCDWEGDPSAFVNALVDSRWLDRDPVHRLLIHDWPDHCERWVKAKLEKMDLAFVVPTTERSTEPTVVATTERSPPRDQTEPIQTKPNRRKSAAAEVLPEVPLVLANDPSFVIAWNRWIAYRKERRFTLRPMTVEAQLEKLSAFGPAKAREAIENSICNGWQGLFDPGEKQPKNAKPGGLPPARERIATDEDLANWRISVE